MYPTIRVNCRAFANATEQNVDLSTAQQQYIDYSYNWKRLRNRA